MSEKNNKFTRGECDRCGASLRRTKQRGKYYCNYCQAIYFDNNYSDYTWEEDSEELPTVNNEQIAPDIPIATPNKQGNSIRTVAIIVSVVIFAVCMISLLVGSLSATTSSNRSGSRSSERDLADEKPQMLDALPQAVQAGNSLAYGNWELSMYPDFSVSGNQISFGFGLINWHDETQIFRFEPKTFIVYDDLGNSYPISLGSCAPDLPFIPRQLTFSAYERTDFQSNRNWCNQNRYFPTFSGVISQQAKFIYFHFEDFGVFKEITFVFEL